MRKMMMKAHKGATFIEYAMLAGLVAVVVAVAAMFFGDELKSLFQSTGEKTEQVNQAVAQSGGDMAALVQALDFLPDFLRDAAANALLTAGEVLPEKINALLEPLFLPLVQALLFVVLCLVVRWVFALLVRLLRGVNAIPLLGGANQVLGLAHHHRPA